MARFLHHHLLQMIVFRFLTLLIVLIKAPPSYSFPIAKPGCEDRCGDVSIPFPFGMMTPECYLSDEFLINCNKTSNPHKPILTNSPLEITNISLRGQLTLLHVISRKCYAPNNRTSSFNYWINFTKFTINSSANKFTVIGCDTYANKFTGTGCCQIPIPDDVSRMDLTFGSFSNYTTVSGLGNCSYAFVVEESAYTFSPNNLTKLMDINTKMPMVADWTVGNVGTTCEEEAKMNASSYACKGVNATCLDNQSSYGGYRCSCKNGYQGNPYLEDGCQDIDECLDTSLNDCEQGYCVNRPRDFYCSACPKGYHGDRKIGGKGCTRSQSRAYKLEAGIALGVIVLLLSACWFHLVLKRRNQIKMRQNFFVQNGGLLLQEQLTGKERASADTAKIFSESELKKATDNFNNNMIVGQGGFGTVYKGLLNDNRIVAIKKSKAVDPNQIDQFVNEVIVLSQINHRNVVKLLGCCLETEVPLLVYEFISNGTLFEHVHNKAKARSLSWDVHLKLATETAGVLAYLHSSASTPIIHRDVKSANILLDHTFTAKVADFGASKLVPLDQTQLSTMVQGTFGYLDPEYMQTNQLTEKSDVYSFGVVLVELLTGMKALSYDRPEEDNESKSGCSKILRIMPPGREIKIG